MDRFIGMDVHAASTTVAVIDARGQRLHSKIVETNGSALVEFLQRNARGASSVSRRGDGTR